MDMLTKQEENVFFVLTSAWKFVMIDDSLVYS